MRFEKIGARPPRAPPAAPPFLGARPPSFARMHRTELYGLGRKMRLNLWISNGARRVAEFAF